MIVDCAPISQSKQICVSVSAHFAHIIILITDLFNKTSKTTTTYYRYSAFDTIETMILICFVRKQTLFNLSMSLIFFYTQFDAFLVIFCGVTVIFNAISAAILT